MSNNDFRPAELSPSDRSLNIEYMSTYFKHAGRDKRQPHVHTFYEIMWFWEEGGKHSVDFLDYDIHRDTLIFIAPGQVHHFVDDATQQGVLIQFNGEFLNEEASYEDVFVKYDMFNTINTPPFFHVDEFAAANLRLLVEMMLQETIQRDLFGHQQMMRSLLRLFITNVRRCGVRDVRVALDDLKPTHRLYIEFRQLVEREYARMHTVGEYASQLNVSVKTLTNTVVECTGTTPLQMIKARRTLEAKRLLLNTSLPLKEVSAQLGFDDPSYFVKFFKREAGSLPFDFRNNVAG